MSPSDIAVIVTLALIAGYPALGYIAKLPKLRAPTASPQQPSKAEWRQRWVQTLISLQTELEDSAETSQADLCRQLIWEILGGDPDEAVE